MKSRILLFIGIVSFLFVFTRCAEDLKGPLVVSDKVPEPPLNIQVENMKGGARINYTLPDDAEVLYVHATYSSSGTDVREAKSSVFKNYIVLEGFADTLQYDVTLRTVTRSEVYSQPVVTKIKPLKAPIHDVFESLVAFHTFGGVHTQFTNETENEYVFYTLIRDSITNEWTEYDRFYTLAKEPKYSVRGLESIPTDFAFYFKDKWNNFSDTLFTNLTPLYEEEFDKSLWKDANLADDTNRKRTGSAYSELSGLWTPGNNKYFFQDPNQANIALPNWFTIDVGREYIFSRINVEHVRHADTWMYSRGAPQLFEIWASDTASTNWEDWTLLGKFESYKPSGLPLGELTAEDRAHIQVGDDFDFILTSESFRYVRFKTLKTWGGQPDIMLLELTLYGQPVE